MERVKGNDNDQQPLEHRHGSEELHPHGDTQRGRQEDRRSDREILDNSLWILPGYAEMPQGDCQTGVA